jgi:hypothetical protein
LVCRYSTKLEKRQKKNPAIIAIFFFCPTTSIFGQCLLTIIFFLIFLAHFDRERIPERVVHAKGAGAHGVFGKMLNLAR